MNYPLKSAPLAKCLISFILLLFFVFTTSLTCFAQKNKNNIRSLGSENSIHEIKKYLGKNQNITDYEPLKKISAKSAIIIDAKTGLTLFERDPDQPRQPASTIKIITGTLALETLQKQELIPVSRKASRQPRSKIYLDSRKQYLADDLINAVLLASANDASVALAEKIAGSEKDFAQKMTTLAKSWGATNTICKTASGLTAKGQQSTSRDLAIIFEHAMQNKEFADRMHKNKIKTSDGKTLHSHNKALWQVNGALGGKTGYTNAARQTYVGKFTRNDEEIIVAIMGSETMWRDIKRLVKHGFSKKLSLAAPETIANQKTPVATATSKDPANPKES